MGSVPAMAGTRTNTLKRIPNTAPMRKLSNSSITMGENLLTPRFHRRDLNSRNEIPSKWKQ